MHWNKADIPHKGWVLVDVYDVREEAQSVANTSYEQCMMCNNERIRFVHVVSHPDYSESLKVGCICAEKMTNDYVNPKRKEKSLRNKAQRRINWLKKEWSINKSGNLYLRVKGDYVLIFQDKKTKKYKCLINETFGQKLFDTIEQAKVGAFNGLEYFKKNS